MVSTIDLLPTFARVAGAERPTDRVIDGEDLMPLLTGEKTESPHEFVHYFGGGRADKPANYRAIRNEKWKLFVNRTSEGDFEPSELYHLGVDPSEKYDKLNQYPDVADELLKKAQVFYDELESNRRPVGELE